jgi:cytochrome c oxidase subunit 3
MNSIHLVDYSPWPLLASISLFSIVANANLLLPLISLVLVSILWFRDIIRESQQGHHTLTIQAGLTSGFILFLISEIMLFFSLFWTFFHSSLAPTVELALIWPPVGLHTVSFAQ